jgi:hypothetical protein
MMKKTAALKNTDTSNKMKDLLLKIEGMFDDKTKAEISKKISRHDPVFAKISKEMRDMVITNDFLKKNLFKNRLESLYYSGDILVETIHDWWIKGGDIEDIFLLKMEEASCVYGFDWEHRIKNN